MEERLAIDNKILSPEVFIKLQANPMKLESSKEYKNKKLDIVGPSKGIIDGLEEAIVNYFNVEDPGKPFYAAV